MVLEDLAKDALIIARKENKMLFLTINFFSVITIFREEENITSPKCRKNRKDLLATICARDHLCSRPFVHLKIGTIVA